MLVEQFLCWMTTADARQRADAAGLLVRLHGDTRLTELDREAVEAGLTVLLDDPVTEVRQALAAAIIADNKVPHHLALTLAHDVPEVAAIIIGGTTQLLDGEMVDLVAVGGPEVQRAAAARQSVSPALAAALAEVGDKDATVELLLNPATSLAEFSHLRILQRLGSDFFVRRAMELRETLTIAVRQMIARLAIAEAHGVTLDTMDGSDTASAMARDASDKETVELAAAASDEEIVALVAHLRRTAQLTSALILRAAVTGEMRLAGEAIGNLAGVSADRVFLVMERGEDSVFAALIRKAGLPERVIPALIAAAEVARELAAEPQCEASYAHVRRMVERVVTRYRDCRDDEMDDLIATLRRYAGEAARDAARRYFQRTVTSQSASLLIDTDHLAEALLPAPEVVTESEPSADGFSGLGAAFDDATFEAPAWDMPESTVADEVAPAAEEPMVDVAVAEEAISETQDPAPVEDAAPAPEAVLTAAAETSGLETPAAEAIAAEEIQPKSVDVCVETSFLSDEQAGSLEAILGAAMETAVTETITSGAADEASLPRAGKEQVPSLANAA